MNRPITILLSIFLSGISSCVFASTRYDVFTSHDFMLASATVIRAEKDKNVHIHLLDQNKILLQQLNQKLRNTADLDQATQREIVAQQAKEFLRQNQELFKSNISQISLATELKVTQLPAVVINKKYQVLGTTDIQQSDSIYRHYLENKDDNDQAQEYQL